MIATIIITGIAFYWLLLESDYMRVRLPLYCVTPVTPDITPDRVTPVTPKVHRTDNMLVCSQCREQCNSYRSKKSNRTTAWTIPAKTIEAWGSKMNFAKGCNVRRANLLRAVFKYQKQKVGTYSLPRLANHIDCSSTIEITCLNGNSLSLNGDYKIGMIRQFVKNNKVGAK